MKGRNTLRLNRKLLAAILAICMCMSLVFPAVAAEELNAVYGEANYYDIATTAYSRMLMFQNGVVPAKNGSGLWGLIDMAGNLVVECQYRKLEMLGGDEFRAIDSNSHVWIINSKGAILREDVSGLSDAQNPLDSYDSYGKTTSGYYRVFRDGEVGLLDRNLDVVFPVGAYDTIAVREKQEETFFIVARDGETALLNANARAVLSPEDYTIISDDGDSMLVRTSNGSLGRIDFQGNILVTPGDYDGIGGRNAKEYIAAYKVINGKTTTFLFRDNPNTPEKTFEGKRVYTEVYYRDLVFANDSDSGTFGVMDVGGNILIQPSYTGFEAGGIEYDLLSITGTGLDKTYGLYKAENSGDYTHIFSDQYSEISHIEDGKYKVQDKTTKLFGILDSMNENPDHAVIPVSYSDLRMLTDELVSVRDETGVDSSYKVLSLENTELLSSRQKICLFDERESLEELYIGLNRLPYWMQEYDRYTGSVLPFRIMTGGVVSPFTTVYMDFKTGQNYAEIPAIASNINENGLFAYATTLTDDSVQAKYGIGYVPSVPWNTSGSASFTPPPGVRFVPYSFRFGDNTAIYEQTGGTLPAGLTLTNGVLSGIPTQAGTFTFTITSTISGVTEDRSYALEIKENREETGNSNVWYDTDAAYEITVAIPNQDDTSNILGIGASAGSNRWSDEWQTFRSKGPHGEFTALWLDGEKLERGTDYTDAEGSTVLTIRTQTLASKGDGTHTLSAEFRKADDTLKTASQNFTLTNSSNVGSGSSKPSVTPPSSAGSSDSDSSDTPTSHQIALSVTGDGTVSPNSSSVLEGRLVTLTVQPGPDSELSELTVTGPRGKLVLTRKSAAQYTFYMPDGDVSISAVFVKRVPASQTPFVDIQEDDWFYPSVVEVYKKGWMTGVSHSAFAPQAQTSRGMIVTILHKLEGSPTASASYFADVPLNQYYAQAAAWAAEQGIVTGYGDGRFGPDDRLTREQLVVILNHYARMKGCDTGVRGDLSQFSDLHQLSDSAKDALAWANAEGLMTGKGDGVLDPAGPATRAEMAAILEKFSLILN